MAVVADLAKSEYGLSGVKRKVLSNEWISRIAGFCDY